MYRNLLPPCHDLLSSPGINLELPLPRQMQLSRQLFHQKLLQSLGSETQLQIYSALATGTYNTHSLWIPFNNHLSSNIHSCEMSLWSNIFLIIPVFGAIPFNVFVCFPCHPFVSFIIIIIIIIIVIIIIIIIINVNMVEGRSIHGGRPPRSVF